MIETQLHAQNSRFLYVFERTKKKTVCLPITIDWNYISEPTIVPLAGLSSTQRMAVDNSAMPAEADLSLVAEIKPDFHLSELY
jgi:CRISPR/Cas system-associated protein Cas10 (large subunit of type III CRISPR-Cas system)